MHRTILIGVGVLGFLSATVQAQVPQIINYQGRVVVGTTNFNGTGQFKFALVNANGTTTYWSNDGTSTAGSQPTNAVSLNVSKGLYSVLLGDTSVAGMTVAIPSSVFTNSDVRLRVWFNDGTTGSQLLTPDQRIASTGYSMVAGTVPDGAITSAKISTGAVGTGQIAAGSITSAQIDSTTVQRRVTGSAPSGSFITGINPDGTVTAAAGGAGSGPWSLNGADTYYNNGNIGIGTKTPKHHLSISYLEGSPVWTSYGWIGAIDMQTGSAIGWRSNQGGQRFGMGHTNDVFAMFRTASDPGTTGSPPIYDFAINDAGNVGIGTTGPVGKLHVYDGYAASERIESGGSTNSWSRIEFKNGNGQWDVGTSRGYIEDAFYIARDPSPPVFTVKPNGDTYAQGLLSCAALTIRGGADLAEPFQMKEDVLDKGSVVVIDEEHPGRLKRSTRAYDKRVAGIVSGANGINPGIALQQEGALEGGQNVALTGRVYVQANATNGPIAPGDMLTTSDTPGYAMKVTDSARAQGAVIGKAMSPLQKDSGTVLVLVTLQ